MPDFRLIPSIEQLRQRAARARARGAVRRRPRRSRALREAAAAVRGALAGGDPALVDDDTASRAGSSRRPPPGSTRCSGRSLEPVINATGVIVHTNLGRAPLAAAADRSRRRVARGYASLEYDLGRGARGRRDVHADALLCRLTGAERAVVVNNNAAATMIVLAALAAGPRGHRHRAASWSRSAAASGCPM